MARPNDDSSFMTDISKRQREEKLIEMLVNAEFPLKKRSKTSEEILVTNARRREIEEGENKNDAADYVHDASRPESSSAESSRQCDINFKDDVRTARPDGKGTAEKTLNQLLKEMDKMEETSVFLTDRTPAVLRCEGGKQQSFKKTSENGSGSRVLRAPVLKVPPLDARLLTTHSVLVGDLSLGRNFKIIGRNGEPAVDEALYAIGWHRLDDFPHDFYSHLAASALPKPKAWHHEEKPAPVHLTWADTPAQLRNAVFVESEEMVNHVPNMALLSDKIKLYESLSVYERQIMGGGMRRPGWGIVGHVKMDKFVPTTYRVDVATDRTRFYREFQPGQIWICKPANDNCGRGIFLVRSLDEFHTLLTLYEELKDKSHQPSSARPSNVSSPLPSLSPNSSPATFSRQQAFHNHTYHRVVQRYISNPLLVEGRKLDLRAYLLVASTDPYVVLFRAGYVRIAMDRYDAKGQNPFSHLTNQYVQKKHPEYEAKKDDSVWTMDKFNDFVNASVAPEVGAAPNWAKETLPTEMKKIMVQCFQAIRPNLPSTTTNGRFELLGFDFMLDDKLNLWLLEVNVNPALATNNKTLASVIPAVVQEALYIAIECFEKRKVVRGPLSPLHTCKEFQVIYEEYSSSKWIFGQNPSPRWNPSFVFSEEEKARVSVARRQALCPRVPLGGAIRGKWAAPHEENSPDVICAIAATRHLIQTMREALETREKEARESEDETSKDEEQREETEVEGKNPEVGKEEDTWLRERWR